MTDVTTRRIAPGPGGLPASVLAPLEGPVTSIIVKLAARCNLACDYCYWFRDPSVLAAPKTLRADVEDAFIERLRDHVVRHAVPEMAIILHGGEPLLFGKHRFAVLCARLRVIEAETGSALRIHVTTNGVLLDEEWAALLRYYRVHTAVSIDGPAESHDAHRVDFKGRGTLDRVLQGLEQLRLVGIEPGILAVADPAVAPARALAFLADELGCRQLDFLVPDATHEDAPPSIAEYFIRLFDLWLDTYADKGVEIRLFSAIIRSLCGYSSGVESIGYGPTAGVTLCTDGSLEAHDVVRIAGNGATASGLNVMSHDLDDIRHDPLWRELWASSLQLAPVCDACQWRHACGGGHIASRWSVGNRFDNASVYCADWTAILSHIWQRISPTLTVEVASHDGPAIAACHP